MLETVKQYEKLFLGSSLDKKTNKMEESGIMNRKKRTSCILYAVSVCFLLVLDQFTKYLASARLKNGTDIILIKDIFRLHYLENQGAAFGLLQGRKLWFVAVTVIMLALMVLVYLRIPLEKKYRWLQVVLSLLTAGAIGNLIDRLRLDYVVDFFYFEWINFPIFNVADIYVSVGMALLMVLILFYYKDEELEVLWPFGRKKPEELEDNNKKGEKFGDRRKKREEEELEDRRKKPEEKELEE